MQLKFFNDFFKQNLNNLEEVMRRFSTSVLVFF